jgi:hypothetical protein
MKINIEEFPNTYYLKIIPETLQEMSLLFRLTTSTKREAPSITTYFKTVDESSTEIILNKKYNIKWYINNE